MAEKIDINLLPSLPAEKLREQEKFKRIQNFSIFALAVIIFLATFLVFVRIIQAQNINKLVKQTGLEEDKVLSLKDKEAELVILKDRVKLITQLQQQLSNQSAIYASLAEAIPSEVAVSSLAIDRLSNVLVSVVASKAANIEKLISNLTSKKVTDVLTPAGNLRIDVESLSRGKDGIYRANFRMTQSR